MFVEFLYPLGFLAAASIIVPVVIHLWRKQTRKVLQVGSIRVFDQAKRQRINRLRIANWPLLLLRCLLILILSACLATPYVDLNRRKADETGWVLLGSGYEGNLSVDQQRLLDNLLSKGYGLRAFEPGFRSIDRQAGDTVTQTVNPFNLIRQLNEAVPFGFPVMIFSRPRISDFTGNMPTTSTKLTWHVFAQQADTAHTQWATRAWKNASGDIALTVASSNINESRFESLVIEGDGSEQGVQLIVEQGQALVKLPAQSYWVRVADAPLDIRLATDSPLPDTEYLNALLASFQQANDLPMEVNTYQPGDTCDLLFDFTTAGVHDNAARTVFRYMQGEIVEQRDNHLIATGAHADRERIKIHKVIVAEDDGEPIWSDSYGRPVLTASRQGEQILFRCYIRFNPQWTDLVWSTAFVNSLLPLLIDANEPLLANSFHRYPTDERAFTGTIDLPYRAKAARDASGMPKEANAIPYLVWLALLVFAAERIMTYRFQLKPKDG